MTLTVASLLRTLVTEHRTHAPQFQARTAQQAVRDDRSHDARGRFGPQRQLIAALIGEGIHLLLHDVGVLADRALEEIRALYERHADFLVAVCSEQLAGRALQMLPRADLRGQDIVHAANRLDRRGHWLTPPEANLDR